jgi:hypothetical protein
MLALSPKEKSESCGTNQRKSGIEGANMSPITIEDAARAVLNRQRQDDDDPEKTNAGVRQAKITLPRVAWLEKPGPQWDEPPKPAHKREKAPSLG